MQWLIHSLWKLCTLGLAASMCFHIDNTGNNGWLFSYDRIPCDFAADRNSNQLLRFDGCCCCCFFPFFFLSLRLLLFIVYNSAYKCWTRILSTAGRNIESRKPRTNWCFASHGNSKTMRNGIEDEMADRCCHRCQRDPNTSCSAKNKVSIRNAAEANRCISGRLVFDNLRVESFGFT